MFFYLVPFVLGSSSGMDDLECLQWYLNDGGPPSHETKIRSWVSSNPEDRQPESLFLQV